MLLTLIVPVMCESFSDFPLVLMSAMTNFIYTELSKQTVVIENRGRVSHPEVAWTVLRLDLVKECYIWPNVMEEKVGEE